MNAIRTTHNLDFEAAPWECMGSVDEGFTRFRIGTCEGLWASTETSYDILAVINEVPGNGNLIDVMQWFMFSCKRDRKDFRVLELWNKPFRAHLIRVYKFRPCGTNDLIKKYKYL